MNTIKEIISNKKLVEETIGQIAAKDLGKAKVFKKYGMDFCCGGKKTLKEACIEKGLDTAIIEQELQIADKDQQSRPMPFNEWKPDFLVDYIVNVHHQYVRKTLPDLRSYSALVASVHSAQHPELLRVNVLIELIIAELMEHMVKEEVILFPFIKQLDNSVRSETVMNKSMFSTVENPIAMMESEHEMVGQHFAEIRSITRDYTLPQDACASYTFLFNLLKEFENDLFTHIHLENNILFPQALFLEKSLN